MKTRYKILIAIVILISVISAGYYGFNSGFDDGWDRADNFTSNFYLVNCLKYTCDNYLNSECYINESNPLELKATESSEIIGNTLAAREICANILYGE